MLSDIDVRRLTSKYDIGNVPGYLSYPAVSKWRQPITDADVLEAFRASSNDAYLYFHFPYCETLCYYCTCYMKVTSNPKQRYDEYIRGIEREMDLKLRGGEPPVVGDMHWGGGTPTYMDCAQIERVFRAIDRRVTWKSGATLSIEAYPDARTMNLDKLELLRSLGFSQISFGIESLDPVVLAAINRRHDFDSIRYWVERARALGFGVHVDLVYGLPHQSVDSLRRTVDLVMSVQPDRLATFSFMYTPSQVKHQRVIPESSVPDSRDRFHLYEVLQGIGDHGYRRVGCDHWVRGNDPLAVAAEAKSVIYHFQGYEPLTRETFLGFGSSAISFAQNKYFMNTHDVKAYLSAVENGNLPVSLGSAHVLSHDDQVRHYVIMKSIMSDLVIDKDSVEQRFGIVFDEAFAAELVELRDMERDGLVAAVNGRRVLVTALGRSFIRNIGRVFDRYFARTAHTLVQISRKPTPPPVRLQPPTESEATP
jgi:oxygen-independent coproporphyrinogen III oxidase